MPAYNSFEWEGLEIKGQGAGWRAVPILRKLPIFSGRRPSFWIQIRAKDKKRREDTVSARWYCFGPGGGDIDSARKDETASLMKKVKLGCSQTG